MMDIALIVQLRGGVLFRWRRERGLSQAAACRELGLPVHHWRAAESMRFDQVSWSTVGKIAAAVGCLPEEICPPALFRQNAKVSQAAFLELPPDRLLGIGRSVLAARLAGDQQVTV
jgi:hypothetical protein